MEFREPLKTGAVLDGEYRIDQVLGAGGFGITYLAEDIKLRRPVAIKEYFPAEFALRDASHSVRARSGELGETFRWGLDSFLREAQFLARFEHPAITRVIRILEANNTAYMVLRYEEGLPLRLHLDNLGRPMTEPEVRNLAYPLIDALEVVHAQSILHRDISPDNIIVQPDGRGVLIDFGAARRAVADKSQALTGIVREGYSPPEQFGSGGRQGPWTDIYALGAVLYHCLTGTKPMTSIHRILEDQLVPVSTAAAGRCGESLAAAVERAMRLKSSERPQTIAAFRQAFVGQTKAAAARQPAPAPAPEPPLGPAGAPASLPPVELAAQATQIQAQAVRPLPPLGGPPQALPTPVQPPPRSTSPSEPPRPAAAHAMTAVPAPLVLQPSPPPSSPPAEVTTGTGWMPLPKLLFSFSGRINRAKLWLGSLLVFVIAILLVLGVGGLAFATGEIDLPRPGPVSMAGMSVAVMLYLWMTFALYAKRAHDRGWSGWFSLLLIVPLIGLWPMIELLFLRGEPGPNRFGPSPLPVAAPPRST